MTAELRAEGMPLRLGRRIGKGGEGEVFLVDGKPDLAAKVYDIDVRSDRETKIRAMISSGLAGMTNTVAFPRAAIESAKDGFIGFTMPLVKDSRPFHELYAPGQRKRHYSGADYRFLVRTALNLARVIAATHRAGCIIGDINHSGIFVSTQATVTLIDADSFQFQRDGKVHLCKVGVPEYTPPELQGRKLAETLRTPNHDAFGLAVALFLLLFLGRHPFAGVPRGADMTTAEAIAAHAFAYSARRRVPIAPPPESVRLTDLPEALSGLFERAFSPEGVRERPSAAQWVSALEAAEGALTRCTAVTQHYHLAGQNGCPWCRIERETGSELFPSSAAAGQQQASPGLQGRRAADLEAALRAIRKIEWLEHSPVVPASFALQTAPPPPLQPVIPRAVTVAMGGALCLGSGWLFMEEPQAWPIWSIMGAGGLAMVLVRDRGQRATAQLLAAEGRYRRAVANRFGGEPLDKVWVLRAEAEGLIEARGNLERTYAAIESQVIDARVARDFNDYMARQRIADADLDGIGPALIAALHADGFRTAADVRRRAVTSVRGIGEVKRRRLEGWAEGRARRFVPNTNLSAADRQTISERRAALTQRFRQLDASIESLIDIIGRNTRSLEEACADQGGAIGVALADWIDARAEVEACGRVAPAMPKAHRRSLESRTPTDANAARQRGRAQAVGTGAGNVAGSGATVQASGFPVPPAAPARQGNPSCPKCGSAMVLRTARRGIRAGRTFWGCSRYPTCTGTRS